MVQEVHIYTYKYTTNIFGTTIDCIYLGPSYSTFALKVGDKVSRVNTNLK